MQKRLPRAAVPKEIIAKALTGKGMGVFVLFLIVLLFKLESCKK